MRVAAQGLPVSRRQFFGQAGAAALAASLPQLLTREAKARVPLPGAIQPVNPPLLTLTQSTRGPVTVHGHLRKGLTPDQLKQVNNLTYQVQGFFQYIENHRNESTRNGRLGLLDISPAEIRHFNSSIRALRRLVDGRVTFSLRNSNLLVELRFGHSVCNGGSTYNVGADFSNCAFVSRDGRRVNFAMGDFSHASFYNTSLRNTILAGVVARNATFLRTDCSNSIMRGFVARGCLNFNDANFEDANLGGADLSNCHFYRANLNTPYLGAILNGATYSSGTTFHPSFTEELRHAAGMRRCH